MADPTDRLASFSDDGDPVPLAPAEAVRARGEQRRRTARTTAALAGTAMVLAAGTAFGLSLGGGSAPDSLGPASPAPTVAPSEEELAATPAATSTTAPTTSPTPAPDPVLLTAADARASRSGTWSAGSPPDAPLLAPCEKPSAYAPVTRSAGTSLTHTDGQRLRQSVLTYQDEAGATRSLAGLRAEVDRCPSRELGDGRTRYLGPTDEPGSRLTDALFVEAGTGCGEPGSPCDDERARYAAFRVDRTVVVLELAYVDQQPRTTDTVHALAEQLAQLAHRAAERASCADGGSCATTRYAPADLPRPAALQQGGTVWAVYLAAATTPAPAQVAAERARKVGYVLPTQAAPYDCDEGGKEALGYSDSDQVYVAVLYFATRTEAQAFERAFDGEVVTSAPVRTFCLD